jgi:hypothetical protein
LVSIVQVVSEKKCFEKKIPIGTKLPRNDHWKVLYKVSVFYAGRKSKIATIAEHKLTLDPMGKCSNAFFSETTNLMKAIPIGSNVKLSPAVAAILNFISEQKRKVCRGPSNEHSCTV